ncbi:MAG TPA: PhzF family phenazine biosynthesis protein [Acidobacteriota bacterium]|jgi:predicted PhzF superfamily epimerase YddE/YHI9|nr:PhzF family phenazine biosynthesis protein [Acidobacteriota bacterium]
MTKIPLFQIDAFTGQLFAGNPAAICPLEQWLDDKTLQGIAAENNLSETAYLVARGADYEIRWFTPATEVDLCGHATLASAFVLCNFLDPSRTQVTFLSKSGPLKVTKEGELFSLDFPARDAAPCKTPDILPRALRREPKEVLASRDYLAVYDSEEEVRSLEPDMELLKSLDRFALIVTAPGRNCDFVSRFFAPAQGIPEDPVTGSAHCTLVPYWSRRLGKSHLHALQVSSRGGELFCEDRGDRVIISGRAVKFMEGTIDL